MPSKFSITSTHVGRIVGLPRGATGGSPPPKAQKGPNPVRGLGDMDLKHGAVSGSVSLSVLLFAGNDYETCSMWNGSSSRNENPGWVGTQVVRIPTPCLRDPLGKFHLKSVGWVFSACHSAPEDRDTPRKVGTRAGVRSAKLFHWLKPAERATTREEWT